MTQLVKKTATAALIATALVTPTAVALQQSDSSDDKKLQVVGDLWVRTELFFGMDKPGPDVTDYQFQRFINDTVTPRFPDGLTVLAGNGQWKDSESGKIVREHSKVLIIVYPIDAAKDSSRKLEEIRSKYEKQFQQESVMRADSTENVSF
ncbi:MAG TPA: DUF3574 domain-containing protein [Kribbella sp.]|uniref:DUF3574 domain-containing protein n=1 Tax=Kribbella sp. TaxID=1871183 RepID=UPI002D790FC3|nr:DUF3574 domain-containing protein [Kribbella sp.]HET6293948.1 DUF3574 domain-containing protein [Kribbella sp.]